MMVAAGALLVAGVAGLMTAEAQPGRGAKLADLKRVEKVQKEFNTTIDGLVKLARSRAGAATKANLVGSISVIVGEKTLVDFNDNHFFVYKQGGLTLDQLLKMQKEINGRFDAMKKAGKLTELDRKILSERTLTGMHGLIRRR
jgi:hypothetical protein